MLIAELMEKLATFPPTMRVVLHADAYTFEDVGTVKNVSVLFRDNEPPRYYGQHDETYAGGELAVVLGV
jgi:hypothetical protein